MCKQHKKIFMNSSIFFQHRLNYDSERTQSIPLIIKKTEAQELTQRSRSFTVIFLTHDCVSTISPPY